MPFETKIRKCKKYADESKTTDVIAKRLKKYKNAKQYNKCLFSLNYDKNTQNVTNCNNNMFVRQHITDDVKNEEEYKNTHLLAVFM